MELKLETLVSTYNNSANLEQTVKNLKAQGIEISRNTLRRELRSAGVLRGRGRPRKTAV